MYQKYFYLTKEAFERDLRNGNVPNTAIVFIKSPAVIWTHLTYYTGGSGGDSGGSSEPKVIDIAANPIYYRKITNRDQAASIAQSTDMTGWTTTNTLSRSSATVGTMGIRLQNLFLLLSLPSNITITRIVTSRQETLSPTDNFTQISISQTLRIVYIYTPVIAPEDLTLTFTFKIS